MQHSKNDRCDRCPAQGYTTWTNGQHILTFCGHHTTTYVDNLAGQGFTILVDDRGAFAAE